MSQHDNQDPEMGDIPNDHLHESSQGESGFGDGSAPLYMMYSKIAEEEDNKMIERWQKDAEGIIIFTGLFSAVIAAVVVASVQDLKPNSQDTSAFYLEKMYQLQVDPKVSLPPITTPLAQAPAFSLPSSAIWVNSLWFLSLVISLTCAMLATLLQQWARRYVRTTQVLRRNPEKRARMRAYFANGVDKFHVTWAVETLPTLVHLSLLMFFAGLLIYLFNINHTVFTIVVCWVALASAAYVCITLMPIFWHDSPYYAPLSSTFLILYAAVPYALFTLLTRITDRPRFSLPLYLRFYELWVRYQNLILGGIGKAAEVAASRQSQEIDGRVLEWTVDALHENDQLEKFLVVIPGFFKSHAAENLQRSLPRSVHIKIAVAAGQFLSRTLSSSLIPEFVTSRRLVTCLNAADVVGGLWLVSGVLRETVTNVDWKAASRSVEVGHFLKHWVDSRYGLRENIIEVQCMIACIIPSVQERDSRWTALTLDQLGVQEQVLRYYLTHGESVLLANLIHISRLLLRSPHFWVPVTAFRLLSNFDVHGALPGLQHDFCVMWNEAVEESRKSHGINQVPLVILNYTRNIYIALHSGTDAAPTAFSTSTPSYDKILWKPSSYPLCSIPDHLSIPHNHNLGMGEDAHVPVITHPTNLHHDPGHPAPDPIPIIPSLPTGTDIPSFPNSNQGPATLNTTDESPLGDFLPSITTSPHHDLQVSSAGTVTSPKQGIPITTQDAGMDLTTLLTSDSDLRSTLVVPAYIPQLALTRPSSGTSIVSGQRNADYHATFPGPSTPPDTSISSPLLLPPPGHTPSVILQSLTATSASLPDQNRPTASLVDPQEASDSGHVE